MRKALTFTIRCPKQSKEGTMIHRWAVGVLLGFLILGTDLYPAFAAETKNSM